MTNKPNNTTSKQVKVLARGIQILQLFAPNNPWLSNHEIANQAHLPRPTVSRLTAVLFSLGLLQCSSESGKYRLAISIVSLGRGLFDDNFVWRSLRPDLTAFAEKHGGVVVIAKRVGLHMLCLEACQNKTGLLQININRESRLDLVRSAVGRAWFHSASCEEQNEIWTMLAEKFKDDQTRLELIRNRLTSAKLNEKGIYLGLGNLESGINGLGIGLTLKKQPSQYALGVAGTTSLYSESKLQGQLMSELIELKDLVERFANGADLG